jgi:hypothetical protein
MCELHQVKKGVQLLSRGPAAADRCAIKGLFQGINGAEDRIGVLVARNLQWSSYRRNTSSPAIPADPEYGTTCHETHRE